MPEPKAPTPPAPATDPTPPAPETVTLTKEEWTATTKRLDAFEQRFADLDSRPAAAQPPTPSAPTPSIDEQIAPINERIHTLTTKIDEAIAAGQPISDLQRQRDELLERKITMRADAKLAQFSGQGFGALSDISSTIMRDKMPHLKHRPIRESYEAKIASLPAAARANPATLKAVYDLAVGENLSIVLESEQTEAQRRAAEPPGVPPPPARTPTSPSGPGSPGDFASVFGEDALRALRTAGRTPEDFVKHLGYKSLDEYVQLKQSQEQEGVH